MKHLLLIVVAFSTIQFGWAQGNSQVKGKQKNKTEKATKATKTTKVKKTTKTNKANRSDSNTGIWEGTNYSTTGKPSKNQPAKVRAAFQRDYPNAGNVVWSKYRGDWTATFNNNLGRSTAIYHANGERRDTRTVIDRNQLPGGTVWDRIFKRDQVEVTGNIVRIEAPTLGSEIFRIATRAAGNQLQYFFYSGSGSRVQYNY